VITKLLIGSAIVLGAAVGLAAPAGADPDFTNLTCSCRTPDPATSPSFDDLIHQGLQDIFHLPSLPGQQTPPQ